MKLLVAKRDPKGNSEFVAIFEGSDGKKKTIRFGTSSNYVSNPNKTKQDRAAYIARHKVREDFNNPLTRGALSRWLLWGQSRSFATNLSSFKKRFNL